MADTPHTQRFVSVKDKPDRCADCKLTPKLGLLMILEGNPQLAVYVCESCFQKRGHRFGQLENHGWNTSAHE